MKKLMIAAAIVCAAAFSQAATYEWANYGITSYGQKEYASAYVGQVYLMDSASMTQTQFIQAFNLGTSFDTLVAGAFNSAVNSDGYTVTPGSPARGAVQEDTMTVKFDDSTYAATTKPNFYQVVYDNANKALYVSELLGVGDAGVTDVGSNYLYFNNEGAAAGNIFEDKNEFVAGGWYTAVPEPTSGLLLLLGVAGLALRRRRA